MRRFSVAMWGKGTLPPDFTARVEDGLPVLQVIGERIARRMRLHVCGGPRIDSEGKLLQGWTTTVQVTLGRSLGRGQGYTDIREVWCSVREVAP